MSSFVTVSKKICRRLSDDVSKLAKVYDYTKMDIPQYPVALVIPSENEADYATTSENRRAWGFTIRLMQELERKGAETTERILRELVDETLQSLDEYYTLGGDADIVRAAPSRWGWAQIGGGWIRIAEISLTVEAEISIK
jgi:hypothetical protein